MKIDNSYESFVELWHKLEATRQLLAGQCRRFCVRNILRSWFPPGSLPKPRGEEMSFDDFVWKVCRTASPSGEILGWTELPPPGVAPRKHRELLRALAQVSLGLSYQQVKLKELDGACPFPVSLNVGKKKKRPPPDCPSREV